MGAASIRPRVGPSHSPIVRVYGAAAVGAALLTIAGGERPEIVMETSSHGPSASMNGGKAERLGARLGLSPLAAIRTVSGSGSGVPVARVVNLTGFGRVHRFLPRGRAVGLRGHRRDFPAKGRQPPVAAKLL